MNSLGLRLDTTGAEAGQRPFAVNVIVDGWLSHPMLPWMVQDDLWLDSM